MKVEGTKEFDAPAQLVWDVLNDPSKMAKLLPGRRELRDPGRPPLDGVREGAARHGRAEAELQVREARGAADRVREADRRRARASARSSRWRPSSTSTPDGERTHMDWVADVRVAGPIGSDGPARLPADRQPAGRERAERARGAGRRGEGRRSPMSRDAVRRRVLRRGVGGPRGWPRADRHGASTRPRTHR